MALTFTTESTLTQMRTQPIVEEARCARNDEEQNSVANLLASMAIIIAILALLFGGYFTASWAKKVSKPVLSVVVENIRSEVEVDVGERQVEIPTSLRSRMDRAAYFPSFTASVRKKDIESQIEVGLTQDRALAELRAAEKDLSSRNEEGAAQEIWNAISWESKTLLINLLIERSISEIGHPSDEDIVALSEPILNDEENVDDKVHVLQLPAGRKAVAEHIDLIGMKGARPLTKNRVLEAIRSEIDGIEARVLEYSTFMPDLEALLKDGSEEADPRIWTVSVAIYNAGAAADSVYALGALSVRRSVSDADNRVLIVEGREPGKVLVPPGGVAHIELSAKKEPDELEEWFSHGDKNCVLSIPRLSGGYVTSQAYRFSSHTDQTKEDLEQFAKVVTGH